MLCVVVPEVEDGDFSHLKGSALNVHSSVIESPESVAQNQNPTVFERLECVAKFIRASLEPATNRPADCPFLIGRLSNQRRDGLWLARINFATHSSRSNTVGF